MKVVLAERNRELMSDLDELMRHVGKTSLPQELEPYKSAVVEICKNIQQNVRINLLKLALPDPTILLQEVTSDTGNALFMVRRMSEILVPALIQDPYETYLSLKIVVWLHQSHPQMKTYPPVVTSGSWGILPLALPIYYVPLLQQRRLLHQPLLFHEFGHQLYRHHKPEMDQLVEEFQLKVLKLLTPSTGTNDDYYEEQMAYNQAIAFTWYRWIQELFCDAVGFEIGGPSFLKAFSASLSMIRKGDFHLEQEDLIGSSHPVTWLRVHFLTQRARSVGLVDLAQQINRTWNKVATAFAITEDYYGVYDDVLQKGILQTLDDMLVEADPIKYQFGEPQETSMQSALSPVGLLNSAWTIYETQPDKYLDWERRMIDQYLNDTMPPLAT